jgi:dTDP-4-dehydrorhamnose 3,5-epimerase
MFKFVNDDELKDVVCIEPFYSCDNRGFFLKCFENDIFLYNKLNFNVSEIFITKSVKNVIRGLHFQYNKPQTKLVTAICGECLDVIVDLRANSPSYLKYKFFNLNSNNKKILYVPKGFAHGFLSLSDDLQLMYICDGKYDKESDTGIVYNDSTLNINWPIKSDEEIILSDRDLKLLTFNNFLSLNIFKGDI